MNVMEWKDNNEKEKGEKEVKEKRRRIEKANTRRQSSSLFMLFDSTIRTKLYMCIESILEIQSAYNV